MDRDGTPLAATFSFWATLTGLSLAVTCRGRRVGAVLLLLVGYGGIGVAWERATGCDLRRLRIPPRDAWGEAVTHAPFAALGTWLLTHEGTVQ